MVNWSPALLTAVSDLEVEYTEEQGFLYFFKYVHRTISAITAKLAALQLRSSIYVMDWKTKAHQTPVASANTAASLHRSSQSITQSTKVTGVHDAPPAPRYPLADSPDGAYLPVATTRPETILGDTAVAVNPKDERFRQYVGKEVVVPMSGRRIKVREDRGGGSG
jgi:isoleucyl-tRNA synthetase